MTEGEFATQPDEALLSRLALIDERPLESRAAAYRQLHDELRQQLEATDGDTARTA
ncbi:hypothetical protein [Microcella sp.]|uniref:hypothetical protein n=1 Tax=Microcella sp. TaxID=1913979 RepID=UPI003F6F661A